MGSKPFALEIFKRPSSHDDVEHAPVTSVLQDGDVPYTDHAMDADEQIIVALGYKQEFKREFSLWTTFCVSFAVLGLLPSFASTIYYGIVYSLHTLDYLCHATNNVLQEWDMLVQREWSGAGS